MVKYALGERGLPGMGRAVSLTVTQADLELAGTPQLLPESWGYSRGPFKEVSPSLLLRLDEPFPGDLGKEWRQLTTR